MVVAELEVAVLLLMCEEVFKKIPEILSALKSTEKNLDFACSF